MGLPFMARTISLTCRPDFKAGPSGITSATRTTQSGKLRRPSDRRRNALNVGADFTPVHPPLVAELREDGPHDVAGYSKAEPFVAARLAEDIKVLMPMILPSVSTSGPPPLPGLIEASVWERHKSWFVRFDLPRPGADYTHTHRVFHSQRAAECQDQFPLAQQVGISESRNGRLAASTLSSARSVSESIPTIFASVTGPPVCSMDAPRGRWEGSRSCTRLAFATTWPLVMMYPSALMITPEPDTRCRVTVFGLLRSSLSP